MGIVIHKGTVFGGSYHAYIRDIFQTFIKQKTEMKGPQDESKSDEAKNSSNNNNKKKYNDEDVFGVDFDENDDQWLDFNDESVIKIPKCKISQTYSTSGQDHRGNEGACMYTV